MKDNRPSDSFDVSNIALKVQVVLKEYEILRDEAHQRLSFFCQILYVYVLALGAVYSFIAGSKRYDLLLLFPWLSLGLYLRLLWDQKMCAFIDDYIRNHIEGKMTSLIGPPPQTFAGPDIETNRWFGWFDYFPTVLKRFPPLYKHAVFVLFVWVSIFPSLAYAGYHVAAHFWNWRNLSAIPDDFRFPIMLFCTASFAVMTLWMTVEIYVIRF